MSLGSFNMYIILPHVMTNMSRCDNTDRGPLALTAPVSSAEAEQLLQWRQGDWRRPLTNKSGVLWLPKR